MLGAELKLDHCAAKAGSGQQHCFSSSASCLGLPGPLVRRAHLQANHLILIRRQLQTTFQNRAGKKESWLVSRAAAQARLMNSSRDLSTSSHQCQSKTVKDSKDSELKAKVEATVRSPAGADEQFYDRNFVTAVRAMTEFLLKPQHLVSHTVELWQ